MCPGRIRQAEPLTKPLIYRSAPGLGKERLDFRRRFGGIERLYGTAGLAALGQASVCVIGVGGVGSWAVEALARSAIGRMTLIDMDHAAESNMNRQLTALESELGRAKVEILRARIDLINPCCRVQTIEDFVAIDNIDQLVAPDHDWVLDCVDSYRVKAALIAAGAASVSSRLAGPVDSAIQVASA